MNTHRRPNSGPEGTTLSAQLGGYLTQPDDARAIVVFRDELLNDLATVTLGPVTNVDRGNMTTLHGRCSSVLIPANVVSAAVRLSLHRYFGIPNDGYVYNVSLYLENEKCSPVCASRCPE